MRRDCCSSARRSPRATIERAWILRAALRSWPRRSPRASKPGSDSGEDPMRRLLIVAAGIAVLAWAAWRFTRRVEVPVAPMGVDSVRTGVHSVELWFASADGDSLVREARDVVEPSALHE